MSRESLRSAHHLIDTYLAGLAQRLPADSDLPGWLVAVVAMGIPLVGEPIMSRYRRRVAVAAR
jgi:hypothetical protein